MERKTINNIQLGAFVLAGLLFLVVLLYLIGKNMSLFGDTYLLKARFDNAQGLVSGNNVRFSGIQAGTVKEIRILNDTTLEVSMLIDKKLMPVIRTNAVVSIGTEGLVGNKVVNIVPAPSGKPGPQAAEGDILFAAKSVSTDQMLQTLYKTNSDVAEIAAGLKQTVMRINTSSAFWALLNDNSIPREIRGSLANVRRATASAGNMVDSLNAIVLDVKNGKGSVGSLLRDSSFARNLNEAILKLKAIGQNVDSMSLDLSKITGEIRQDITHGKGTLHALLKDSAVIIKLNAGLDNIVKGTDGFNQNMEALKHNFLFRGYFRRQEKQKAREAEKQKKNPE